MNTPAPLLDSSLRWNDDGGARNRPAKAGIHRPSFRRKPESSGLDKPCPPQVGMPIKDLMPARRGPADARV